MGSRAFGLMAQGLDEVSPFATINPVISGERSRTSVSVEHQTTMQTTAFSQSHTIRVKVLSGQ